MRAGGSEEDRRVRVRVRVRVQVAKNMKQVLRFGLGWC